MLFLSCGDYRSVHARLLGGGENFEGEVGDRQGCHETHHQGITPAMESPPPRKTPPEMGRATPSPVALTGGARSALGGPWPSGGCGRRLPAAMLHPPASRHQLWPAPGAASIAAHRGAAGRQAAARGGLNATQLGA